MARLDSQSPSCRPWMKAHLPRAPPSGSRACTASGCIRFGTANAPGAGRDGPAAPLVAAFPAPPAETLTPPVPPLPAFVAESLLPPHEAATAPSTTRKVSLRPTTLCPDVCRICPRPSAVCHEKGYPKRVGAWNAICGGVGAVLQPCERLPSRDSLLDYARWCRVDDATLYVMCGGACGSEFSASSPGNLSQGDSSPGEVLDASVTGSGGSRLRRKHG